MRFFLTLLTVFLLSFFLSNFLPHYHKSLIYSIGLVSKKLLFFSLPIIIFSFGLNSILELQKRAPLMFIIVSLFAYISGVIFIWVSHLSTRWIFSNELIHSTHYNKESVNKELDILWDFNITNLLGNYQALIISIIIGTILIKFLNSDNLKLAKKYTDILKNVTVNYIVKPIVPFIISGSVIKICHDGDFQDILFGYGVVLLIYITMSYFYLLLFHFFIMKLNLWNLKNILPAYLIGLTTASSAVALPLLVSGVEKNCRKPEYARAFIPILINIHPVGNHLLFPILISYLSFFYKTDIIPSFDLNYILFSFKYSAAVFTSAAVPGGSAMIIEPLLKKIFLFEDSVLMLFFMLYSMIDLISTPTNMIGNNLFIVMISRFSSLVEKFKKRISSK